MATSTYTSSNLTKNVFNPNDFIDSSSISKSEADARYINSSQNLETLLGSINITGDETVTNQFVTGTSSVGGNSFVTGDTIISGVIRAGVANNAGKDSIIYGNVTLGDQLSAPNTTKVYMLGENIIGLSKPTKINGAVTINTDSTWGSNTVIGKSNTDLTIHSKTKIENNTIEAGVIGDSAQPNILKGSTIIGEGYDNSSFTSIGGTLYAGDGLNDIYLSGKNTGINNTNGYTSTNQGSLYIGSNTNHTTYISGNTRLIGNDVAVCNPKLCDTNGNIITTQNFNLNNPSYFVFNQNLSYNGSAYTSPDTSTSKQLIFYLYTPPLTNSLTYSMTFEFVYYIYQGKLNATAGSIPAPSLPTQDKVIQTTFSTLLTKATGNGTYTFTNFILGGSISPFTSFSSSSGVGSQLAGMISTCIPLGISKDGADRLRFTISFPRMTQSTPSSSTEFVMAMGASLRLINSNVGSNQQQVYPNNSSHSLGGISFFSLS